MTSDEDQGRLESNADLGRRLREAREYVGLSQEQVAKRMHLSRASVSTIEAGKRRVTALELTELARVYGVSVNDLLNEPILDAEGVTISALFRTTRNLSVEDQEQVLRFARFLKSAGRPSEDRSRGRE
jgi:transcriptional regulator with XRE-family HTH domain